MGLPIFGTLSGSAAMFGAVVGAVVGLVRGIYMGVQDAKETAIKNKHTFFVNSDLDVTKFAYSFVQAIGLDSMTLN
jgi:hypothetical protein